MVLTDKVRLKRKRGQPRRRVKTAWWNPIFLISIIIMLSGGLTYAGWKVSQTHWIFEKVKRAKESFIKGIADKGFVVRKILVKGRVETSRQDLLEALKLKSGMPILAFDTELARIRVESLPWIKKAVVERQLPDLINLYIVEREPLALWQRNGTFSLIDIKGDIIPLKDVTAYNRLIVVVGDDAPINTAKLFDVLSREPQLVRQVTAAVRVGGRRWNIHLNNQTKVLLPEKAANVAWSYLAKLYQKNDIFFDNLKSIDLRLGDRIIILQREKSILQEKAQKIKVLQLTSKKT